MVQNQNTFVPNRVVSENEFEDFIAVFRPIEEEDIVVGIECIDGMEDMFVAFMERLWVARIDALSVKAQTYDKLMKDDPNYEPKYPLLKMQRGCTFEEYCKLYRSVDEDGSDLYPAYNWFTILDEEHRKDFTLGKTADVEQYIKDLNKQYQKDFPNSRFVALNFFLDRVAATVPHKDLKRHAYISGKSGSGKSELMKIIFYNLQNRSNARNSNSLIVIDPHGELTEQLKALRLNKENFDRLVYIDPFLQEGYTPTINPLQIKDRSWQSIDIMSQNIESVFQEIIEENSLSVFMRTILRPTIATLLWKGDASLQDLQRFLNDDQNSDLVELGKRSPIKEHRTFFETDFYNGGYKRTKTSIRTKLQSLLNSPTFTNLLCGQNTVDLEHEMNAGKVILFNLAKGMTGPDTAQAFGIFIVGLLSGFAQKRITLPPSERKPTFLFIDECQNYMTQSVKDILAENRKYGLHLILANQYLYQVKDEWQRAMKSNTDIKILGRNDSDHFRPMAANVGVSVDRLLKLPKYHFYIKSADRTPIKVKSPNFLLGTKNLNFYLTNEEIEILNQQIIATDYYKPIKTIETGNDEKQERKEESPEQKPNEGVRQFRFEDI